MERIKYFRSQIVTTDRGAIVYWAERHDGENFDIHPSDIPENAVIYDVTDGKVVEHVKRDGVIRKP